MPIALGVLLVAVLALGFMSMQAMLERLNEATDQSTFWQSVLSPLSTALNLLNRGQRFVWKELVAIMSRFAGASLHALAHWFWSLEHLVSDVARAVASLSETMGDAIEHMVTTTIPHAIRDAVKIEEQLRKAEAKVIQKQLHTERTYVRGRIAPKVDAHEHAIAVTIPGQFAGARARDRAIAGRIPRGLTRRLTRLEKITTVVAVGGIVVRVLARRFPWLFCRKTTRLGKALCGLDNDLLNDALLGALVVWSGFSIVEAVKDLQAIEDEAIGIMKTIIREL